MLRSSSMREAAENSRLRKRHRPAPKEDELPTRKLREKLHVVSMRDGDLKMCGVRSNNNEGMAFSVHWKGGNDAKQWQTVSGEKGDNFTRITIEGRPGTFEATIDRFYIYKQFRRHGLGSRVMRMLQNKYRDSGTKKMKVTNATSEGAIFYKKNGFDVCPVNRDLVCDLNKAYAKASPASPLPPPPLPPAHPGPASPLSLSRETMLQKVQDEAAKIFNYFEKPAQNTNKAKAGPVMRHETKCKCCSAANSGACMEFDSKISDSESVRSSTPTRAPQSASSGALT